MGLDKRKNLFSKRVRKMRLKFIVVGFSLILLSGCQTTAAVVNCNTAETVRAGLASAIAAIDYACPLPVSVTPKVEAK